jgi:hypothetical protein
MMTNYTHLKTGIDASTWMQGALEEARFDPYGMWQMVKVGRDGFGLQGAELEVFIRNFIIKLMTGGAEPVVGDKSAVSGWTLMIPEPLEPSEIANLLIGAWKSAGKDPDVDGTWFAFRSAWS